VLERTHLFFISSQLQLIALNQLMTVGVTQTSVCSIIYEGTSEICVLLWFCFTFFYGTVLTFKLQTNVCILNKILVLEIWLYLIYSWLLNSWNFWQCDLFLACVCVLNQSINCEHYVYCKKICLSEISWCLIQTFVSTLCLSYMVTFA